MEWISVKERLPETGEFVLVFSNAKYNKCYGIDRHVNGEFYNLGSDATHWMYLPLPPNETET